MKQSNYIALFLLYLLPLWVLAGDVSIYGKSEGLSGKKISVNIIEDYLSLKPKKIHESYISGNGDFKLVFPISEIREVILKVDGLNAFLYVQPGAEYHVQFAPLKQGQNKSYTNNQVELLFDTLPTYDINNLILDFDERLDAFMAYNLKILGTAAFQKEIDTMKVYLTKVYKDVNVPYFRDYIFYSVGEIEQIGGINVDMVKLKAMIFRDYFSQGKVLYHHQKFMTFFSEFYTDVFKLADARDERLIFQAINNKRSPKMLNDILARDALLRNDRIRELVMIKALGDEYFSGEYYPDHIISILDSVRISTNFPEHSLIAANLIAKLTQLDTGYPAPGFQLNSNKEKMLSVEEFKGKYIYLHFYATWNSAAVAEMKIMTELHKKYGQDIVFISINMDDDRASWLDFLKQHPEMKWHHAHYSDQPEIIDNYRITSLSVYYLIGPDGKMVQSPAYKPTPNGTFVSIDQTFFEIYRKLHPRVRSKPGEK